MIRISTTAAKNRPQGTRVRPAPTFAEEKILHQKGYHFIAGIDEVGRGPLAGPVVAAAVILSLQTNASWLNLVRDSKQLSPSRREFLFDCINEGAVAIGVGMVSHETIDEQGIASATRLAMCSAVEHLPFPPDFLLIDHITLPDITLPQKSITRGDSISLSIAAASIVAKVTRDRLMSGLDRFYSAYRFAQNKGYATTEHILNLQRFGACPIHRKSFSPVREVLGVAASVP